MGHILQNTQKSFYVRFYYITFKCRKVCLYAKVNEVSYCDVAVVAFDCVF